MTAICLEDDGRQIAAQEITELVFDVGNSENFELNVVYQLQLSLLRSRCGRHDCRCLRDVTGAGPSGLVAWGKFKCLIIQRRE